ncbi:MAG: nucleotidyltransferase family protein [Bacteroidales bacterium]|nr:nucleotidyltransferase family protein [Bacteroidales bacterium]
MITEAIILAGGFGTRLQKVVKELPKPMAPINGRPFLEYQLNYLSKYGINRIIFSVGYLSESISSYFGDKFNGIDIEYAYEENPLGTGGGILNAFHKRSTDELIVLNGDTLFEIDLKEFYLQHKKVNSLFSLALRELESIDRYGSVLIEEYIIRKFAEKGELRGRGVINGGVYIINKRFFEKANLPQKFSMEKDVFEKLLEKFDFYGFPFSNYFLDIGIPEDYKRAQDEFKKLNY